MYLCSEISCLLYRVAKKRITPMKSGCARGEIGDIFRWTNAATLCWITAVDLLTVSIERMATTVAAGPDTTTTTLLILEPNALTVSTALCFTKILNYCNISSKTRWLYTEIRYSPALLKKYTEIRYSPAVLKKLKKICCSCHFFKASRCTVDPTDYFVSTAIASDHMS